MMETLITAVGVAVLGMITTFVALLLLRAIVGVLPRLVPTAKETDATGVASLGETAKRLAPGVASKPGTAGHEELAAIMAALTAMGVVGPAQEGRIRIEEISS
jgi:hypothetical protein